jgi:hypothetical protein
VLTCAVVAEGKVMMNCPGSCKHHHQQQYQHQQTHQHTAAVETARVWRMLSLRMKRPPTAACSSASTSPSQLRVSAAQLPAGLQTPLLLLAGYCFSLCMHVRLVYLARKPNLQCCEDRHSCLLE